MQNLLQLGISSSVKEGCARCKSCNSGSPGYPTAFTKSPIIIVSRAASGSLELYACLFGFLRL